MANRVLPAFGGPYPGAPSTIGPARRPSVGRPREAPHVGEPHSRAAGKASSMAEAVPPGSSPSQATSARAAATGPNRTAPVGLARPQASSSSAR